MTLLIAAHLGTLSLSAPGCATEVTAQDRKIADAGREGRELLRELQQEQAAKPVARPGDALKPSAAIKRQAAKMRSDAKWDAGKRNVQRPDATKDGVNLSKGICVGCLK